MPCLRRFSFHAMAWLSDGVRIAWLLLLRFPAVHRPLLTYVNTALVAPALGHQVGYRIRDPESTNSALDCHLRGTGSFGLPPLPIRKHRATYLLKFPHASALWPRNVPKSPGTGSDLLARIANTSLAGHACWSSLDSTVMVLRKTQRVAEDLPEAWQGPGLLPRSWGGTCHAVASVALRSLRSCDTCPAWLC